MDSSGQSGGFWDDGDWIDWDSFGEEENTSHLAELEREAELRWRFPNADISLVPFFQDLLSLAEDYHRHTSKHLQVYGDIGELFGAIMHGIKLHRNYAQGSDGRLGDDFIEIKTITPFNRHNRVTVSLEGNFNKLLIVKINEDFRVSGRFVDRKRLGKTKSKIVRLTWDSLSDLA